MKKAIGFGNDKSVEEHPYSGKWVIIYPQGLGNTFCGKVQNMDSNYAILNPFYTTTYIKREREIYRESVLVKGDLKVPLINAAIELTTKNSLENFVRFENEKRRKEIINKKTDSK